MVAKYGINKFITRQEFINPHNHFHDDINSLIFW